MTGLTRRSALGGGAALLVAGRAGAAPPLRPALPLPALPWIAPGDERIDLWPGPLPEDRGVAVAPTIERRTDDPAHPDRWVRGVAHPAMLVRRPAHPNGTAVLVMPGGGYDFLSWDNEGLMQAAWLTARGITAFVLAYRLPNEGWGARADVPLIDAQRAVRTIRAQAGRFAVRPDRIGVLGFSAGGHLAGSLATGHAERLHAPVDAVDRLSARPDVAALVYPVVSLAAPFAHAGSRDRLLGAGSDEAARVRRSVERHVDAATPPTLLIHAADDDLVPAANSIALYDAMRALRRPVALHIFEGGGHGFGTRLPATNPASAWPDLFAAFAAGHGLPA